MVTIRISSFVAALALMATTGSVAQAASRPVSLSLSESDNGKTVHVVPGEVIIVTLPENRSTGTTWLYLSNPRQPLVTCSQGTYNAPASTNPPMVGAQGTGQFTFIVSKSKESVGKGEWLTLLSVRPWVPKLEGYHAAQLNCRGSLPRTRSASCRKPLCCHMAVA
jgi:predicted secreted protein